MSKRFLDRSSAIVAMAALIVMGNTELAVASSHREAPGILSMPQVDATDFYMFRSYEPGREGFVTLIANYHPLQDPYGGPNYFPLSSDAFYDIHINNDGPDDEQGRLTEDLTFRFKFTRKLTPAAIPIGDQLVPIPLVQTGPFGPFFGLGALTESRTFTLRLIRGPVEAPTSVELVTHVDGARARFGMPFDNIGERSIPNYDLYAGAFIHQVSIPGCDVPGRVFVGQRRDSFAVNLGEIFDLFNTDPLGSPDGEASATANKNITSLALEVPTDCLTNGGTGIIGGWTTARLPRQRTLFSEADGPTFDRPDLPSGDLVQVSRLGNALVNELLIGLPDKNLFNASHPRNDGANFQTYVTHPSVPELIQALFGVEAPNHFPRTDLIAFYLTGIEVPGVAGNTDGTIAEVVRLNTAIPLLSREEQNPFGAAGGDFAGFPNGRRPGDDVVDITLRGFIGIVCYFSNLCTPQNAPAGLLPLTDGVTQNALMFGETFPYLNMPIAGSPNATP